MKLRIRGNTLRLRLTRSEVDTLAGTGAVEDQIRFGPTAMLRYRVEATEDASTPMALLEQTTITVRIANASMKIWTSSELVGIYGRQTTGDGNVLEIALEKDFACLERRSTEDDSGSFPHPKSELRR